MQVGGTTYDALAAMMDQTQAERVMQVNYFAFARIARAALRPMLRARHGRIVAIGSVIGGMTASQGNAAYGASKAALLAYVRTLAIESAKRGITVNYIAPGLVDTEMMAPFAAHRAAVEDPRPRRAVRHARRNRRRRRVSHHAGSRLCERSGDPRRRRHDRNRWPAARLTLTGIPMRALQLLADRDLALIERPDPPPPGPGEAQIRIRVVRPQPHRRLGLSRHGLRQTSVPADGRRGSRR